MTRQSTIFGIPAPTSLLSPIDSSGALPVTGDMDQTDFGKHLLSGALTANTYLEIVALTTPGWLRMCGVYRDDATSRSIGLKIIMDGNTVFDASDTAAVGDKAGFFIVGGNYATSGIALEPIRFNSSLSLQVKSTITETDKIMLLFSTGVTA